MVWRELIIYCEEIVNFYSWELYYILERERPALRLLGISKAFFPWAVLGLRYSKNGDYGLWESIFVSALAMRDRTTYNTWARQMTTPELGQTTLPMEY